MRIQIPSLFFNQTISYNLVVMKNIYDYSVNEVFKEFDTFVV
jgi:hypothetical protein